MGLSWMFLGVLGTCGGRGAAIGRGPRPQVGWSLLSSATSAAGFIHADSAVPEPSDRSSIVGETATTTRRRPTLDKSPRPCARGIVRPRRLGRGRQASSLLGGRWQRRRREQPYRFETMGRAPVFTAARHETMKHPLSRELYEYWNQRRGGGAAPERGDIDPAAIKRIFGDSFALSVEPGEAPLFRVAGTRVARCSAANCEARNSPGCGGTSTRSRSANSSPSSPKRRSGSWPAPPPRPVTGCRAVSRCWCCRCRIGAGAGGGCWGPWSRWSDRIRLGILAGATPEPRRRPVRGRERLFAAASRNPGVPHQPSAPQLAHRDRWRQNLGLNSTFRIIPNGALTYGA